MYYILVTCREVSKELNDSGCLGFKRCMDGFRKAEVNMFVAEGGGVGEKFGSDVKVYQTCDVSCDCTYWQNWRCPCRHLLFLRKKRNLPLFDKALFPSFYSNQRLNDLSVVIEDNKDGLDEVGDTFALHSDEGATDSVSLSHEHKFRKVRPVLERMTTILCRHGTEMFLQ